jgi:UDP-glucose:(heptosyl)LPS alpha-1,3-glucosyltransferase
MRFLFALDRYQPSRGGAERYLRDLCGALAERGHEVTVAALEAEEDPFSAKRIVEAPTHPRLAREIAFSRAVARFKREAEFDRVVGFRHVTDVDRYQPHGGLFIDALKGAVRSQTTSPVGRRCLLLRKLMSPKNLFFLHADRALFHRCPGLAVAAVSGMTARSIESRYRACRPRVSIIPNGVVPSRLTDAGEKRALRLRYGLPPDGPLALFAAHNFRLKGLRHAVKGIALHGRVRLAVAGRGRAPAGDRVHFLGEQDDMNPLFNMADVLLHPTFYDPCSLVVLEALGAGVPVITTRYNGAAELMEGTGAGKVIDEPQDHQAIASALEEILDQHRVFQEKALSLGARCDFHTHAQRMEAWLTLA